MNDRFTIEAALQANHRELCAAMRLNAGHPPPDPTGPLCADCRHPQKDHYGGIGSCDTSWPQAGSPRVHVCSCKRFRKPKNKRDD